VYTNKMFFFFYVKLRNYLIFANLQLKCSTQFFFP